VWAPAGVTLKCLLHENTARTHGIDMSNLIKILPAPFKVSPHYRIAPLEKSPPAVAGRGRFLSVNCRPGETFLGGRSYNRAPARAVCCPVHCGAFLSEDLTLDGLSFVRPLADIISGRRAWQGRKDGRVSE